MPNRGQLPNGGRFTNRPYRPNLDRMGEARDPTGSVDQVDRLGGGVGAWLLTCQPQEGGPVAGPPQDAPLDHRQHQRGAPGVAGAVLVEIRGYEWLARVMKRGEHAIDVLAH